MKKLIYLFFAASIIFTSCEQDPIEPPVDPPGSGNVTSDIIKDTTFKLGTYIIDGTIRVRNAKVTIEPGVVFKFTNGSAFDFAYWDGETATLTAKGTKDLPIIFTSASESPSGGDWDGLRFYNGANNCELDHCIIEYAGGQEIYGSVYVEESEISITNSTIREASNVGIRLKHEGGFSAFDNNFMTNIDSYPISIFVNNVPTISGENTYETALGIWIENDEDFTLQGDYTWTNQGIPYYQEGTIRFGAEGQGSIITIEGGTEILFMDGARWDVAYWDNEYATIIADGTEEAPILFSSANPDPAAGDWNGLYFYDGANNCSFDYCTFEFGGDNEYYGMISIENAHIAFTNSEFYYSAHNAITLSEEAWFTNFGGNTFLGNTLYPISILPNFAHTIVGENSFTTDLGILLSNDGNLDKQGEYVWTNQGTPYIVEGKMRIGSAGSGVKLTIEPGTTIKFYDHAQIETAYWDDHSCSFIADGTADEPIIFTSAKPVPNNDDWDGILFHNGSNNCVINNCVISYAGGAASWMGAISLENAGSPLNLSNTHIAHIANNGISVDEDLSSVDYSNNVTFEDIAGSDYYVR